MKQVILNKGKDKAVRQLHPWVFSGAIKAKTGEIENGELIEVLNVDGDLLALGVYNKQSRVAVRLLEWGGATPLMSNGGAVKCVRLSKTGNIC